MIMQMYLKTLSTKFLNIYKEQRETSYLKIFLRLASFIYYQAYIFRSVLYKLKILKTYSLPKTVISIGNITTGGTGKTPLTIELANYLANKGYKVGVLSRGYMRTIDKNETGAPIVVSDGQDILTSYEVSGDEPYLIAKKAKKAIVVVCNDRVEAGKRAIKLGAEVLILDDGFQHIRLKRSENILLINSYAPFDNGQLLPAGHLREPISEIKRASSIVLSNSDKTILNENDLKNIKKYAKNKPITSMSFNVKHLQGLNIKKRINISEFKETAIAFCGIANPQSFFNILEKEGINIVEKLEFPDHYNYSFKDIEDIVKSAEKQKTENIITTEKDAVKIEELCQALPKTFWSAELEIYIDLEKIITSKI